MSYTKIALTALIYLSISSMFAMQHIPSVLHHVASDMKELLFTPEAKTVLTTALLFGCYDLFSLKLYSMDEERKRQTSRPILSNKKIMQLTAKATIKYGVPFGVTLAFAGKYGSWPEADAFKPFMAASGIASFYAVCKNFWKAGSGQSRERLIVNNVVSLLPYCVLGASVLTALQRYRMNATA